jgi:hypothetical protein
MRTLAKTAVALSVLAIIMVATSSALLHAQGVPQGSAAAPPASGSAIVSQSRTITAAVSAISLSGPIDVTVTQAPSASLTIHAEQRLLDNIAITENGTQLRIETRGVLPHVMRRPIRIELSVPALSAVSNSGSGDISASGFTGDTLDLLMHGSGDLRLNGQYRRVKATLNGSGDLRLNAGNSEAIELNLNGSGDVSASGKTVQLTSQSRGSGDLRAAQLIAENASIKLHGSGDADIHAAKKIEASIVGSGDIHIFGQPTLRAVSRSGSGDIRWN